MHFMWSFYIIWLLSPFLISDLKPHPPLCTVLLVSWPCLFAFWLLHSFLSLDQDSDVKKVRERVLLLRDSSPTIRSKIANQLHHAFTQSCSLQSPLSELMFLLSVYLLSFSTRMWAPQEQRPCLSSWYLHCCTSSNENSAWSTVGAQVICGMN